jgi:FKBP-type peptidyl-prolyl cis-trans isomerase 2
MKYEKKDFVKVNYSMWANDKLIQTTDKKLGEENKLQGQVYEPRTIVLGHNLIIDKVDKQILKGENIAELDLKAKDAFGLKKKELIKTFPKSSFDEQKLKPVVGIVYNFNGNLGCVKSISSNRIMVDFNHLLAGFDIKINYEVTKKVTDLKEKISFIMKNFLQLPENYYEIKITGKKIELNFPQELAQINDFIKKQLGNEIDLKDHELIITNSLVIKKTE